MASTSDTFGFEILHKLHHSEIQKKEDVIILFVHWYLVKCGLKCVGIGDNNVFNASEKGSELLPKEWSSGPSFALRYVKNGALYLLCGIKSDDEILINLAKLDNDTISNIALSIETTVSALDGPLETIIPSYETVLQQLQNNFLKPICKLSLTDLDKTIETGTQTPTNSDSSILRSRIPQEHDPNRCPLRSPQDFQRVGVADLIPGARGGGMIFDPFSHPRAVNRPFLGDPLGIPGRLPPGAVPPGARYDPFGPPDLDQHRLHRRRSDDDHMPPPGFLGDMFM